MIHKTGYAQRSEVIEGNWRLLRRYEREVGAYAAELRHAERRGRRDKIDRLRARLAVFEDECAAIAENVAGYDAPDFLADE